MVLKQGLFTIYMGKPVGSQFLFGTLHPEKQDYLSDVPLLPEMFLLMVNNQDFLLAPGQILQ